MLEIFEVLRIIAFICWSMFLVWTILGVVCLTYKPKKAKEPAENVEIVIVSIANKKVRNSLHETIDNIKKLKLKFYVLVDEGA